MARQADLLSVEDARRRILRRFGRLETERVALQAAHLRVLGESAISEVSVPAFANSSMDGFALRSADTRDASPDKPLTLYVAQHVPAGSFSRQEVRTGECARIMTGAPLPPCADTVIPFEEVDEGKDSITIRRPVPSASCVRPAGNDFAAGTRLLNAGITLTAPRLALLASLGQELVSVVRRPVVSIFSTGDELVQPGEPLRQGQIYNSNSPMLAAAVTEAGGEARIIPTAIDDPEAIASGLKSAAGSDLLLTSGGASVGDFDHVKEVLSEQGEIGFWRVRIRPGKPLIFGSIGPMPVIGLPGNPTSAMVTFEEFARPAIRAMLGAPPLRPTVTAVLDEPVDNRGERETYFRVMLTMRDGRVHARLAGGQDSAMILPLARAEGLLLVPAEVDTLRAGDEATVQVWTLPSG